MYNAPAWTSICVRQCSRACTAWAQHALLALQGSNDFVEDLGMEQPTRMDLDFVAHGEGDEDAKHAVCASDYRLPYSALRPGAQVCPEAKAECGSLWGLPHSAQPSGNQLCPRLGCLKCLVSWRCRSASLSVEPFGACTHLPGNAAICSCTSPPRAEPWDSADRLACGESFTQHSYVHNLQVAWLLLPT